MLIGLTIVEIHLSACYAGGVCTGDDLLDELHLLVSCPGRRVDLGADIFKCFMGSHEWWQVLGSMHEVFIKHSWDFCLDQLLHLVVETVIDDKRLLLGTMESQLEGVGCLPSAAGVVGHVGMALTHVCAW